MDGQEQGWWVTIYCYPPTDKGDEPAMDGSYTTDPNSKTKWYGYKITFYNPKVVWSSEQEIDNENDSHGFLIQRDLHSYTKDLEYLNDVDTVSDLSLKELVAGKAGDLKIYFVSVSLDRRRVNDKLYADLSVRHVSLTYKATDPSIKSMFRTNYLFHSNTPATAIYGQGLREPETILHGSVCIVEDDEDVTQNHLVGFYFDCDRTTTTASTTTTTATSSTTSASTTTTTASTTTTATSSTTSESTTTTTASTTTTSITDSTTTTLSETSTTTATVTTTSVSETTTTSTASTTTTTGTATVSTTTTTTATATVTSSTATTFTGSTTTLTSSTSTTTVAMDAVASTSKERKGGIGGIAGGVVGALLLVFIGILVVLRQRGKGAVGEDVGYVPGEIAFSSNRVRRLSQASMSKPNGQNPFGEWDFDEVDEPIDDVDDSWVQAPPQLASGHNKRQQLEEEGWNRAASHLGMAGAQDDDFDATIGYLGVAPNAQDDDFDAATIGYLGVAPNAQDDDFDAATIGRLGMVGTQDDDFDAALGHLGVDANGGSGDATAGYLGVGGAENGQFQGFDAADDEFGGALSSLTSHGHRAATAAGDESDPYTDDDETGELVLKPGRTAPPSSGSVGSGEAARAQSTKVMRKTSTASANSTEHFLGFDAADDEFGGALSSLTSHGHRAATAADEFDTLAAAAMSTAGYLTVAGDSVLGDWAPGGWVHNNDDVSPDESV